MHRRCRTLSQLSAPLLFLLSPGYAHADCFADAANRELCSTNTISLTPCDSDDCGPSGPSLEPPPEAPRGIPPAPAPPPVLAPVPLPISDGQPLKEKRPRDGKIEVLEPADPPTIVVSGNKSFGVNFPDQQFLARVTNIGGAGIAPTQIEIKAAGTTLSGGTNALPLVAQEVRFGPGVFAETPVKTTVTVDVANDALVKVELFGITLENP